MIIVEDPIYITLSGSTNSGITLEVVEPFELVLAQNGYNKGEPGDPGLDGKSAYQVAVDNGFVGTEQEWLQSLQVKPNISRYDYHIDTSYCGSAVNGSLESDSVWTITKIFVEADGSNTITTFYDVKWTDRYTL